MTRRWGAAIARVLALALGAYVAALTIGLFAGRFGVRRHHVESAWFWLVAVLLLFTALLSPRDEKRDLGASVKRRTVWRILALGLASAWLVYSPTFGIGLLSDDFVLLDKARRADFWRLGNEFFRPLPLMLWFALTKVTTGPWVLHFANATLHGVVAGLTGLLALRLGWHWFWAAFATVAVVVHPSAPEAVAWASGVQDLLMAACVVGAVLAAGAGIRVRDAAIALLVLAALLSKETAVAAPLLIALFWLPGSGNGARTAWRSTFVAASVVGVYLAIRLLAVPAPPDDYARIPSGYFLKELLVRPFGSLAVPLHDHTIAAHPWFAVALGLLPLTLLSIPVARGRRQPLLDAWRWAAWVLIAIAPVYAYFFISPHLEGSRYLYLATPAWALLVTHLLRFALGEEPSVRAVLVAVILVLSSAVGMTVNLGPWMRAAEVRDAVLRRAHDAASNANCRTFTFEGATDAIDGAYVFRNGFELALGELPRSSSGADCRFAWTGDRFVRVN